MHTRDYAVSDLRPANRLCTLLSIGPVGLDVLDAVFKRGIRGVDHIVCLNDRDRLLKSPVPTKLRSDGLTIFNTARELLALLPDQTTCLVLGPDARDLRIMLALTEIKPVRLGVWPAFVISPAVPDEEWMALLHELRNRLTCVYLFEPMVTGGVPLQQTVSTAVLALIRFLENYSTQSGIAAPWKKSGRLLVSQYEATGPDRIGQLIAQVPQRLTDEQRELLATNRAVLDVQYNPEQVITVHEFATLGEALVTPFANEKFNLTISRDESLPLLTIRAVLVLSKPL